SRSRFDLVHVHSASLINEHVSRRKFSVGICRGTTCNHTVKVERIAPYLGQCAPGGGEARVRTGRGVGEHGGMRVLIFSRLWGEEP
ncbi:hypothetical protein LTR33_004890, partial [Friedmanniomyces endolithicus]